MLRLILGGTAAAVLICSVTQSAAAQSQPGATAASTECPAAKPKRHGFGLGGLLSAARQAGVGDMLTNRMGGGMFGNGKAGEIANAVAGTAVQAASNSAQQDPGGQSAAAPCASAQGGDR